MWTSHVDFVFNFSHITLASVFRIRHRRPLSYLSQSSRTVYCLLQWFWIAAWWCLSIPTISTSCMIPTTTSIAQKQSRRSPMPENGKFLWWVGLPSHCFCLRVGPTVCSYASRSLLRFHSHGCWLDSDLLRSSLNACWPEWLGTTICPYVCPGCLRLPPQCLLTLVTRHHLLFRYLFKIPSPNLITMILTFFNW
jgi:hypothetical protein